MKVQQIIGADLSKRTIDLYCHLQNKHVRIDNNSAGFKSMLEWFKHNGINPLQTVVVMEHTGLYSYVFEDFLSRHQLIYTKVNALEIKRSMGLIRGKNDKVDAARIACYGYEKKEKLTIQPPADPSMKRLQMLYSTRQRLVKQRAALLVAIKEYKQIGIRQNDIVITSQLQVSKTLDKQIIRLDQEMESIIDNQPPLKQNFGLLQSIKGVGKVIALATIIKTNNFTRFANARKFACYCGTAPFEHSSGTSLKRKARVSHLADKQMKTLLDLSAKTAIQYDKELKEFYQRRTESGKSKMSTINIVRNKIVYRMFAVIKRQTPFVEDYLQTA